MNAAELSPNIKTPGSETDRLKIDSLSRSCPLVSKPPYSQAKKMSTFIYSPRDKSIFRRTEGARDLLTLRLQSRKDILQINPELLVEVFPNGSDGDVIYSRVDEILDRADTMRDGPAGVPDFHPFA